MAIGPKGPPRKPGLSIRGRVIFDTVRGVPRVRPWPPKKPTKPGTPRHFTAKAFGAANRACKVTASVFYGEHWTATRGTPLLPRDLMIAFMYGRAFALTLTDGRIIRSMATRSDVSKSLDMLGNEPGSSLRRGLKFWEATPASLPAFHGAQVYRAATLGPINPSAYLVPWDGLVYDTGGWTDLATNPTRITIPPGIVTMVQAVIQIGTLDVAGSSFMRIELLKNGDRILPASPFLNVLAGVVDGAFTLPVGPILVDPGDYLEARITSSDTSIRVRSQFSSLSVWGIA